jgi:serine/threonine protein kinase
VSVRCAFHLEWNVNVTHLSLNLESGAWALVFRATGEYGDVAVRVHNVWKIQRQYPALVERFYVQALTNYRTLMEKLDETDCDSIGRIHECEREQGISPAEKFRAFPPYDKTSGPLPYSVVEYVSGKTLEECYDRLNPIELVHCIRQVCEALKVYQAAGLVHQDIAPKNIMIAFKNGLPVAKVIDNDYARTEENREATVVSTKEFAAPEVRLESPLTDQIDQFGLGATFYTVITHKPNPTSGYPLKLLKQAWDNPIVRQQLDQQWRNDAVWRNAVTDYGPLVESILSQMLAIRPDKRYKNLDDLIADLGQFPERHVQFLIEKTSAELRKKELTRLENHWNMLMRYENIVELSPLRWEVALVLSELYREKKHFDAAYKWAEQVGS